MTIGSQNDEKVLLGKIATGDEAAFRELFDLYKGRFYALVLKMTGSDDVAEDIVQEVFMNIWDKRASLVEIDNPSSYFFTTVYRRVYRHFKMVASEKRTILAAKIQDSGNTTDEMVMAKESRNLIFKAIEQLPPQQKRVFQLSKQEGLSREDIAHKLQISPNTVKNHLTTATKFIWAFLGNSKIISLIILYLFKK